MPPEKLHSARAHSRLSPSSAKRWLACPASVRLSEGMPNESSVYAAEGTAAHELAQRCLENGYSASRFIGETFNGFTVSPDMADHVQTYLDYARSIIRPGDEWECEVRFDLSELIPGLFGTSDLVIYKPSQKKLWVIDLKYGVVAVEAFDNAQAKIYAMGAYYGKQNWDIEAIEIVIVQPRGFGKADAIETWETTALDLMLWTEDVLAGAAKTEDATQEPNPGEHCKYCPAAAVCPALQTLAFSLANARYEGENFMVGEPSYTPEKLAELYRNKAVLEAWLKSIETLAKHEFSQGRGLPGFKQVASRATRKFDPAVPEQRVVETMRISLGVEPSDMYSAPELLSPAQMEAVVKKYGYKGKQAKEAIDNLQYLLPSGDYAPLVVKESSGTSIVPDEDPRPAITSSLDSLFDEIG